MRYVSKLKKKRLQERVSFNRLLQLWFNYHFFFFRSLIFRGLKLRAFSFFILIKFGLKSKEFMPDFLKQSQYLLEKQAGSFFNERSFFYKKLLAFDDFLHYSLVESLKVNPLNESYLARLSSISLNYV